MPSRLAHWTLSRTRSRPRLRPRDSSRSDGEYYSLTSLPNELLFAVLEFMDDKCLHLMVVVSKRFYHLGTQSLLSRYDVSPSSGSVTVTSSDALRALRIAMTLYRGTFRALSYCVPSPVPVTKDIRRIEALLRRFWVGLTRIRSVSLDFGTNIIARPVGWTIGGLAPKLLSTICGDSQMAVFVVDNGLFTCSPKMMLLWNPYTREQYCKVQMHDSSRQWVPSIRSIQSLDITYPVCTALSPLQPWTMVIVDAVNITTLLLSIHLSPREWSAILSATTLSHLTEVGIWAETITSATSTAFLNRHAANLLTLRYMSPVAEPLPPLSPPLSLPALRHLSARAHYVVHILRGPVAPALFPALAHVELWPDTHTHAALHLLSLHPALTRLTLWLLPEFDPAPWPVFPEVDRVELNTCPVTDVCLPTLLACAFPVLRRVEVNHSFPKAKGRSPVENQAIRNAKHALVRSIALANSGVERYFIDKEFFEP
ncbi:hypothetical protein B0H17DRAFT_295722 [Mycena rosella]|uniref:F-box domain-containing protein n=1 Tax=Mycena rosella TaxID=1033263 RepID=A0AAD7CVJ3_MYCRO|nr:hypothetical protein B0H17DRAFT_295722 [Mycena rosella]